MTSGVLIKQETAVAVATLLGGGGGVTFTLSLSAFC